MFKEQGLQILTGLCERLGQKWPLFLKEIRAACDSDDDKLIRYAAFLGILEGYGVRLNERERQTVLQSFVANSDRDNVLINVSRLFSIKLTKRIRKIYEKIDMYEEADNPDLVDNSGYFGIFYR